MTTKFSKILQLKEKEVEIARLHLEKATIELNSAIEKLLELQRRSNEVDIPSNGDVSMLQYIKVLKDSFRNELLQCRFDISFCENQVESLKNKLNSTQMECEKFKHLHKEETKRKLKNLAQKEAKELDEIANQRFFAKKDFF